ncbi:hypothetical protein DXG01_013419 [Tephrocybe rancida]|nr:hypothetical protein DXG01_013419 [Tephrocybe rancida]
MEQLERPSGLGHRGPVTALSWINREDEPDDGLIYGTALGHLICWKETKGCFEEVFCAQMAVPSEITGLAFDAATNRLAVCNRNSAVQAFAVDTKMELHQIFSVIIDNHLPKAIAFHHAGSEHKDILTFGMHDGFIHMLRVTDGVIQRTQNTGTKIGNVALNSRKGVFCIDDIFQGVAIYRLDTGTRMRTYTVQNAKTARPKAVTFAEDCSLIIAASDHGIVHVFDRRSGIMVDQLKAGSHRIQAIAVSPQTYSVIHEMEEMIATSLSGRRAMG